MEPIPEFDDAIQDRMREIQTELNRLRDEVADDETTSVEGVERQFDRARERIQSLHEHDDDMTNLALREAARALEDVSDRIQWIRSHGTGSDSRS